MATILDVSRRAGVAKSTVSRVLSGRGYTSEKTRDAVLKAAQELNYRPNVLARNLARQTSDTIGLILPAGANVSRYLASLIDEIHKSAHAAGKDVIMRHVEDVPGQAVSSIYDLIDHRCEAVLYYNASSSAHYEETIAVIDEEIEKFPVPVMLLNSYLPKHPNYCVWYEHEKYAAKPVEYLIEKGHRQIAYLSCSLVQRTAQARQCGYQQALSQAGIEYDPQRFIEGLPVSEDGTVPRDMCEVGYLACKELLAREVTFTAICCVNDHLAIGALKALQEHGLNVPNDVALFGFDDSPVLNYFTPSISSVILPSAELISYAVVLCFAHLNKTPFPDYQQHHIDAQLVIRDSVTNR